MPEISPGVLLLLLQSQKANKIKNAPRIIARRLYDNPKSSPKGIKSVKRAKESNATPKININSLITKVQGYFYLKTYWVFRVS